MKIPAVASIIVVALGLVVPLGAMTNSDVIKMTRAELSERTIVMAIENEPADYDTSPDALIELKKAGVAENVIQKIVVSQRSGRSERNQSESAPSQPSAPVVPHWATEELPSIAPPVLQPAAGREYFLRSTLYFEDAEHLATNYARGTPVPINTPVKIEAIRGNSISIQRIDTGERLEIVNVDKHTRKSVADLAKLIFSSKDTPLEELPNELAVAIRGGEMRKGMTKEQVLMARGYPPGHETTSIDSDRWVYWSSRFVRHTIVFSNGRLVEGRGIR